MTAPLFRSLGQRRPDLLALHARTPDAYPIMLESAATGTQQGRYDLLLAAPGEQLLARAGDGSIGRFLSDLDARIAAEHSTLTTPPFGGGWFIYLGYEFAAAIEPTLQLPASPDGLVALAWRMRAAAIYDHATGECWLAGEAGSEGVLDALEKGIHSGLVLPPVADTPLQFSEEPPANYLQAVALAKAAIAAGDIYQANLARAWRARVPETLSHASLYARLRAANPGPFGALAELPGLSLLSTSPERLVRTRDQIVETRPIAGTRPRLPGSDAELIAELRANAKERAEHVMLIDLERNDLGRISSAGSVEVDEFMTIESYAHVHHIVSNVRGQLRPGVSAGAVIRALFPGGTITGCPKVRCMQLIAQLEARGRGAYTGSLGYLGIDGSLDLNILIRTATIVGDELTIMAGAGIVADSDPERELEETRAKARGLLRALAAEA